MTTLATRPRPSGSYRLASIAPPLTDPPSLTDPPPTTEELLSQRDRLLAGDPRRARLRTLAIEANLPMAGRLARRYAGRGESVDDLTQVAAMALIKAVDGFDPSRPTPFAGYAVPCITGALKRHFRDAGWAMRVPRSTQDMVLLVRGGTNDLAHRHGHQPTAAEVAGHLHIRAEDVREAALAAQAYRLDSLDSLGDRSDDQPGTTFERMVGVVDPAYAELDNRLAVRALVAGLPARDRRIVSMRFFGEMTQATIAAEIGISQMHVSRLLKHALIELRTDLAGADGPAGADRGRTTT